MKRFFLYLLSLIGIGIIAALSVDGFNLYFVRHATGISAGKIERLYSNPELGEIPIFGSSVAKCGYVPSMIDTRCFNYAEDGATTEEMLGLLETCVKRGDSSPIIYNLDPWGFTRVQATGLCCDYSLVEELPGMRFYGKLKKNLAEWLNAKKSVTKVVDRGAVLLPTSRTADEWRVMIANRHAQNFTLVPALDEKFRACIMRAGDRRIYIVVSPCSSHWREVYSGQDELLRYLADLSRIPNVSIVDLFSDNALFETDDFVDLNHLNFQGARKFSRLVKIAMSSGK